MLKIVSWNIRRSKKALAHAVDRLDADILMLQESSLRNGPPLGLNCVGGHIDERGSKYTWGTHILSPHPLEPVAIETEYKGSLSVGICHLPDKKRIGLVNIYGLFERHPADPSQLMANLGIHRKLSDVGWWLWGRVGPKVDGFVLAGDFNNDRKMDGDLLVGKKYGQSSGTLLDRVVDFGLTEVLAEKYPEGIQTHWHVRSKKQWQIDHLFASPKILGKKWDVEVPSERSERSSSDHAPIILTIS